MLCSRCENAEAGCTMVITIGNIANHSKVCQYRPNRECRECGLVRNSVADLNCIDALHKELAEKDKRINEMTKKRGNECRKLGQRLASVILDYDSVKFPNPSSMGIRKIG